MKHICSVCISFLCLLVSIPAFSQQFSWIQQITTGAGSNFGHSIAADKQGNSFILGSFDNVLNIGDSTFSGDVYYNDLFFAKYTPQGQLLWAKHIGCPTQDFQGNVAADPQGNSYITSSFSGTLTLGDTTLHAGADYSPYNIFIVKYAPNGKRLWVKQLYPNVYTWLGKLIVDKDGNSLITGGTHTSYFLAKYSPAGELLWQKNTPSTGSIALGPAGEIFMCGLIYGRTAFGNKVFEGDYSSFVCKYNSEGNLLWASQMKGTDPVQSSDITVDAAGNSYITGNFWGTFKVGNTIVQEVGSGAISTNHDIFVAKFDAAGNGVWGIRAGNDKVARNGNILIDENQSLYISGHLYGPGTFKDKSLAGGNFLARLDVLGNVVWIREADGTYNGNSVFAKVSENTLYLTGSVQGLANFAGTPIPSDPIYSNFGVSFLAAIQDTVPPTRPNLVTGFVYQDLNNNGKFDPDEPPVPGVVVKAEPGSYYATSDTSGLYKLYLPAGKFTLSELLPSYKSKILTQTSPAPVNTYSIQFTSTGNTLNEYNFGNQVTGLPFLQVNVAADRRRRCFRTTTTVSYRNQGYAAVENAVVQVYFPQYVIPVDASMGFTRKDSLLTFSIGSLQPGQSGTITITDSVACGNETIRGLTQCVKAVITPSNPRLADPKWDRSDITIKAICKENGLVQLTILNSGTAAMADSASYRIYLDAVQVFISNYKLGSGDSLSLQVPANGRTIRLEADLRPYHPDGERVPNITLEGCGSAAQVTISKGFVDQLPQDDSREEVSVSCLPILDSFDPNDKAVSPAGVGPSKLIAADQPLEYLIRFQNTGTDVAYTVTITDTLDTAFDIASLEVAAASHSFNWSVSGAGLPVLTFSFDNIHLPDSASNEAASHGYIRFRIRPKAGTPDGLTISNQAAIVFDYNSPVITNVVTQTTGQLPVDMQRNIGIDVCLGSYPTQANAGKDITLTETSQVMLQANQAVKGYGYWKLISGEGIINDPTHPSARITGLGVGKNIFEWRITLCDSISTSRITIERIVIPSRPLATIPAPYCQGEKLLPVQAEGKQIRWYADASLQVKLAEGESYQPAFTQTDTLYVTQTVDGYQSLPVAVGIIIQPEVAAPEVDPIAYVCNGLLQVPIQASGEQLKWYSDESLTRLIYEGNTFNPATVTGHALFVTQTVNACTSKASKVVLQTGAADLKEQVFVPNVITPNGDGANDAFVQPQFKEGTCIGDFYSIRIYNRWGKMVFASTDPAFAWTAQGLPTGYYFYEIRYSNFSSQGGLSVLY